ncbi:MAG: hypothetical protein NC299_04960 [Lachnospiraceae bacterium]|nr:hypothetical protein [Ruminococcus sp.]MCM1274700.1 hypothetical protein [Lachnospiraceae bacterium]
MNSGWTTVIIVTLSVFVILVAVGQIFFAGGENISTETALFYDIEEEVPFDGVYLRDETLVYDNSAGILSYEQENGSKVGKSSIVARRYKSDNDAAYLREMGLLQRQVEVLESAERLIGTDNSQLEAISIQINESHSDIISNIIDGSFAAASERQSDMLEAMCKREITLKEADGYAAKKAQLNSEINRLNVLISGGVTEIAAGGTGYFVSEVDGYEGELTYASAEDIGEEKISEVIAAPVKTHSTSAIGKLIGDYHWRVAAVVDTEKMFGLYEGSEVTLRVGSGSYVIDADIISAKSCGDNKAVYVFECDKLNSTVASGRTARFKLIVNSYGGLRVSRKALRYNDEDERGVFIVRGDNLVFKKVNVVYWGEGYVICSQEKEDDYLKLYDEIVTEGKDLYDGKAIR